MTPETRTCQSCKGSFTIESEDFAFYEKIRVPPPTWCPECRMIRRFRWRNEHFLYRRKDEAGDGQTFSGVPPEAPYKTYNHDYWWSDKWDPMDYGRDYDFSRPFFAQFHELLKDVPWCARTFLNIVNSDYSEQVGDVRNAYLCFDSDHSENIAYLVNSGYCKDSYDLLSCFHDELCYENTMVNNSYRTFYSHDSEDCRDVWFSKNCVSCSDCFGCVNLKSKRYHIFNQPYAKEEYFKKLKEMDLGSHASWQNFVEEVRGFWDKFPVKYWSGLRNVGSTGQYLNDTKNIRESFIVSDAQDCKFIQLVFYKCTDSYDYTVWGEASSRIYECLTCGMQADSLKFCFDCWPADKELEYCVTCRSSSNMFGCVGLRNKEYCIFNKQYSKEEYLALRDKIVEQMEMMPYIDHLGRTYLYGEFFPTEFSHLAYNQSLAQDFFPITKEEAVQKGDRWQDPDVREYQTTVRASDLPDHISNASETITREIIQCESCQRAYRIIEPELIYLKGMGLPLPRQCVECRLQRRYAQLNKPRIYERQCQCGGLASANGAYRNLERHVHGDIACPNTFQTSYTPADPEIVYCEQCYQVEVV